MSNEIALTTKALGPLLATPSLHVDDCQVALKEGQVIRFAGGQTMVVATDVALHATIIPIAIELFAAEIPIGTTVTTVPASDLGAFISGGDVTTSRALNTDYVNGGNRRLVHVYTVHSAGAGNAALAGRATTVGGTHLTANNLVGLNGGGTPSLRSEVSFEVDPGATYSVPTHLTGDGAVALVAWIEVDS